MSISIFDERNVWKDYMTWYRGYAAENFDGYKNEMDEYLYFWQQLSIFTGTILRTLISLILKQNLKRLYRVVNTENNCYLLVRT